MPEVGHEEPFIGRVVFGEVIGDPRSRGNGGETVLFFRFCHRHGIVFALDLLEDLSVGCRPEFDFVGLGTAIDQGIVAIDLEGGNGPERVEPVGARGRRLSHDRDHRGVGGELLDHVARVAFAVDEVDDVDVASRVDLAAERHRVREGLLTQEGAVRLEIGHAAAQLENGQLTRRPVERERHGHVQFAGSLAFAADRPQVPAGLVKDLDVEILPVQDEDRAFVIDDEGQDPAENMLALGLGAAEGEVLCEVEDRRLEERLLGVLDDGHVAFLDDRPLPFLATAGRDQGGERKDQAAVHEDPTGFRCHPRTSSPFRYACPFQHSTAVRGMS